MAKLSEKYQRTYLREYAKEAEKNALIWISTDDYLAECLDIHEQCHLDKAIQAFIKVGKELNVIK